MNRNTKEYLVVGAFMLIPAIYTTLIILYWKHDW